MTASEVAPSGRYIPACWDTAVMTPLGVLVGQADNKAAGGASWAAAWKDTHGALQMASRGTANQAGRIQDEPLTGSRYQARSAQLIQRSVSDCHLVAARVGERPADYSGRPKLWPLVAPMTSWKAGGQDWANVSQGVTLGVESNPYSEVEIDEPEASKKFRKVSSCGARTPTKISCKNPISCQWDQDRKRLFCVWRKSSCMFTISPYKPKEEKIQDKQRDCGEKANLCSIGRNQEMPCFVRELPCKDALERSTRLKLRRDRHPNRHRASVLSDEPRIHSWVGWDYGHDQGQHTRRAAARKSGHGSRRDASGSESGSSGMQRSGPPPFTQGLEQ